MAGARAGAQPIAGFCSACGRPASDCGGCSRARPAQVLPFMWTADDRPCGADRMGGPLSGSPRVAFRLSSRARLSSRPAERRAADGLTELAELAPIGINVASAPNPCFATLARAPTSSGGHVGPRKSPRHWRCPSWSIPIRAPLDGAVRTK